jgi:hypothetical protein
LGVDEKRVRILARDPQFTSAKFYEFEQRMQNARRERPELPITDPLEALIKLDNDGLLYGITRELWKETKGRNFLCFCTTDPDSESAYRMIQTLYREQPSSRQRTICVIACLQDFAMKKSNQHNSFAVALKNKFHFELITKSDITCADIVERATHVNAASQEAASPDFSF